MLQTLPNTADCLLLFPPSATPCLSLYLPSPSIEMSPRSSGGSRPAPTARPLPASLLLASLLLLLLLLAAPAAALPSVRHTHPGVARTRSWQQVLPPTLLKLLEQDATAVNRSAPPSLPCLPTPRFDPSPNSTPSLLFGPTACAPGTSTRCRR